MPYRLFHLFVGDGSMLLRCETCKAQETLRCNVAKWYAHRISTSKVLMRCWHKPRALTPFARRHRGPKAADVLLCRARRWLFIVIERRWLSSRCPERPMDFACSCRSMQHGRSVVPSLR